MRVIIIEDEAPAAGRLSRMLQDLDEEIEVLATLDSVEASVKWLQQQEPIGLAELLFMDIQLADGLSFSIFEQVQVVYVFQIFTTLPLIIMC